METKIDSIEFAPRQGATPTPFGVERAKELWAQKRYQWDMSHVITPGENAYVYLVWSTLPDSASWMTAFFRIMNDSRADSV